ncbi:MAG TPA: response regulator [Anaeromyxobacter sp.]|nr:response regulator [Anaeromyxobacter sp.]
MAATADYVCIFVRATGDRLRAAERLVLALPLILGEDLLDCGVRYQAQAKLLGVTVRLGGEAPSDAARDRLVFWTARAGGRAVAVDRLEADDRSRLETYLAKPTHALSGVAPEELFEITGAFFTELGAAPDRRRSAGERPQLVMDVGGPGWDGVRWDPGERRLFVAAPLAPPAGDAIPLFLRVPGQQKPVQVRATVADVRPSAAAAPGEPAGYLLQLEDPPPALVQALDAAAPAPVHDARAAPRFQVNAPVKVSAPAAAKPARHLIEYATDQELAADFVQNLSQGGAFVRTPSPPAVGSEVELELRLPNGAELNATAIVAFTNANGMGVRFQLAPDAQAILSNAIAHISARARRALVVDDDELVCRMIADALRDRGFEVMTAGTAAEGLSILSEELLALDLLVTDVVMPGMTGEELVQLIRNTGGEVELAIVGVTGSLEQGIDKRLEAVGADAVLDKSLGPDLIAQAADAVLERKRLSAQG